MNHLKTLLWLRLLEFKASFKSSEGAWNLISGVLFLLVLGPGAILLGIGVGILKSSLAGLDDGQSLHLLVDQILLGLNLLIYQISNLFDPRKREGFDLWKLRQFPIPTGRLYFLNLIYSAYDIVFLFFLPTQIALWLLNLQVGWMAAFWFTVLLILFNLLNLALGNLISLWLGRLTAARWRKELLVLFLPVIGLMLYWLPYFYVRSRIAESGALSWEALSDRIAGWAIWLPSGWVVRGMEKLVEGHLPYAEIVLLGYAALVIYHAGVYNITRLLYRQESGGRKKLQHNSPRTAHGSLWTIPLVSEAFSALVEKEVKYLFRSSQGRYAFVWPLIFIIMLRIFSAQQTEAAHLLEMASTFSLLPFLAFLFFFFLPLYVGLFAFDHQGIRLYYLAPVSIKQVLAAKNLALVFLGICCLAESLLLYSIGYQLPDGNALVATFAGFAVGFPLLILGGNLVSCYFPKPLRISALRGNNPPQTAIFLGMALNILALLVAFLSCLLVILAGWQWTLALLLFAGLGLFWVYQISLEPLARLYIRRREVLIEKLTQLEEKP